ncbi:hypothetical protein UlMin_015508 [Ulmus minor]
MDEAPPTADGEEKQANDLKTLVSFYSNYLWNRAFTFLPLPDFNFLGKISNLYTQAARTRSRRRRARLPLPLSPETLNSSLVKAEASRVIDVLEDILGHICSHLHNVQKNLQFWQSRAEGTNSRKAYFMLFERGPRALFNGIRECVAEGSFLQHLCYSASAQISERITILDGLRSSLATFLAQIFVEVDQAGEGLLNDPEKVLSLLLVTINALFSKLEASIGHLHAMRQIDSSIDVSYSFPLLFDKLPEVNQEGSQWTDCEVKDAINLVYQNLTKLDSYVSFLVAKHRKPRKVTRYWIRYTCGAVGLSVCSLWLLKHSSLMGSPDIDNWVREARDSTVSFFNEHVEQPLLAIRDELFETFRKRNQHMTEVQEMKLTSNSLHRMLVAFSEQTKGTKLPENATDQEMLEIVMARYEKELMHPIQNLFSGELARALLIQVQKLKLDIETAMLDLNQILRANEINFALLALLPALVICIGLPMSVLSWRRKNTRAEGRGRDARIQRRLLLMEVHRQITLYQTFLNKGLENDAQCTFGMLLYRLDCLYHAVERHAKASGEWQHLKLDILELGKPRLQIEEKLRVIDRTWEYDCLLPALKRQ